MNHKHRANGVFEDGCLFVRGENPVFSLFLRKNQTNNHRNHLFYFGKSARPPGGKKVPVPTGIERPGIKASAVDRCPGFYRPDVSRPKSMPDVPSSPPANQFAVMTKSSLYG